MRRALLLWAAIAWAWPGSAQFEGHRLVKLNVAATDAKGEPVTDLTAGEVQLKEDGKPRSIAFFRFAGSKRPIPSLGPGEVAAKPAPPATVIVLDRWNERMMTTAMSWNQLNHALQSLETGDGVYVYMLTNKGELLPVRPIPGTEPEARAAAQASPSQIAAMLDDAVKKTQGFRNVDEQNPIIRFNTTFQALGTLGRQMAAIAGRKSLVWVTHGVPLTVRLVPSTDYKDFTPELKAFSAAAVLSGIAIYTVDQSAEGAGATPDTSRETLRLVSELSGGRWYPSDSIDRAIDGAMIDARGNYTVAFYSPTAEKDRKLHKIHLETTRKGIHLQTREGVYGDTPEAQIDELEKAVLDATRRSPFDASEIGLRVGVSVDSAAQKAQFRIHVNIADLLVEPVNQHHQGHLSVMLASYAGGVLKGASAPLRIDLDLTVEQFQQTAKEGLLISREVQTSGNTQQVRAIVFDRQLRSVGSVTVFLTPP
jgi:VWFA-related protein